MNDSLNWNIFIIESENVCSEENECQQINEVLLNGTRTEQTKGANRKLTHEVLNSNEGDVIDLPDLTDDQLESRWMKSDLTMEYCDNTDNTKGDKLKSDVLNEFQSPKVGHLSKKKNKSSIK